VRIQQGDDQRGEGEQEADEPVTEEPDPLQARAQHNQPPAQHPRRHRQAEQSQPAAEGVGGSGHAGQGSVGLFVAQAEIPGAFAHEDFDRFRAAASRSRSAAKVRSRNRSTALPSSFTLWPTTVPAMQLTTQLALFLDNKPGTLARVCDALSAAKINIYAITTSDTVDHSVVRLVVSDPRKALLLFEDHGALAVESEVLLISGDNKPGTLARVCKRLAEAKINIEYAYCATPPDARKGILILRVSNAKKALKLLNS
jgi:hypothetical protein